jgi:hypothetical protein
MSFCCLLFVPFPRQPPGHRRSKSVWVAVNVGTLLDEEGVNCPERVALGPHQFHRRQYRIGWMLSGWRELFHRSNELVNGHIVFDGQFHFRLLVFSRRSKRAFAMILLLGTLIPAETCE